jgi:2-polyprenyl-3-methyl-5-hydroxy-6-metoxy-1,4-benzoquinol methylase
MKANARSIWTNNLVERSCPLCGAKKSTVVSHRMQHWLDLDTVICKKCGFVFTNPIPIEPIYQRFYLEAYGNYYGHISARLSDGFRNQIPDIIAQKLTWISEVSSLQGRRLLEVGPGGGVFMWWARHHGASVVGIEPTLSSVETLQRAGLPCVCGVFEQLSPAQMGQFDLVAMFHVLEHFYDPNLALERSREFLEESGLLIIEVPNILKPFRSLDRYFLRYVHPSSFSPITLEALLGKHGFQVVFMNDGGTDWRHPQNLFLIAQKQHAIHRSVLREDWTVTTSHLRSYQRNWQWWGSWKWAFYQAYLLARRLALRSRSYIKKSFFRK